jgi:hypothetical protein
MTLRELYLHQRAFGAGYHLRRRGTGYSLLDMYNREELECPDIDALESCVKHELDAHRQIRLSAACKFISFDAIEARFKHELEARRQTQLSAACEGRLA